MDIKNRILQVVGYYNISISAFEKKCGLSNGYIRNLKGSIGSQKLECILNSYPSIDRTWLLTGEGEMLRDVPMEQPSAENAMRSDEVGMLLDRLQAQAEEIGRLKERLECLQKSVGDVRSDVRVG